MNLLKSWYKVYGRLQYPSLSVDLYIDYDSIPHHRPLVDWRHDHGECLVSSIEITKA